MDYKYFKEKIYKLLKIDLNLYKEAQMKRRMESMMRRKGYSDLKTYANALEKDKNLLDELSNYITINVSEFYRNPTQWKVLTEKVIPKLMENKSSDLKIWSSASSTGEEPYSLVIALSEFFPLDQIKILATDLDLQAIEKAKAGIYDKKAVKNLSVEQINKFFIKENQKYYIKDEVKKCVTYKQIDLLKDPFPTNMDLILCRNVMIYFTEEAKKDLYVKFNNSLNENGVLFVGSTEQIIMPEKYGYDTLETFFYIKK